MAAFTDESVSELTRDQRRSRRKGAVRARTINVQRLSAAEIERGRLEYPEQTAHLRPRTRGECVDGPRPCPFVSCVHHLYLDVDPKNGSIKLNYPDLEVWEMAESCALDVADREGQTLEEVGAIMNLTRERVRQYETNARRLLHDDARIADYAHKPEKRRLPVVSANLHLVADHGEDETVHVLVVDAPEEIDEYGPQSVEAYHVLPPFGVRMGTTVQR